MTSAIHHEFSCITAAEALALLSGVPAPVLFDVRDMASYQRDHLEGAAQLSEDRLLAWSRRLPKEQPIVIYCYHGNASQVYAQMFIDFRHHMVYSVDGGYEALKALTQQTSAAQV